MSLASHLSLWTYLLFPLFFSSQELLSPPPGAFSGSTLLGGFGGTRIRRRKMHFFFLISFPHRNLGGRGEETTLSQRGGPQEHPASRPVPVPHPAAPGGSPAFIAVECVEEVGAPLGDGGARQLRRDGGGQAGLGARCGYAKTKQTGEPELRVSAPAQGQGARDDKGQSPPRFGTGRPRGRGRRRLRGTEPSRRGDTFPTRLGFSASPGSSSNWETGLRYNRRTKGNSSTEEGD